MLDLKYNCQYDYELISKYLMSQSEKMLFIDMFCVYI